MKTRTILMALALTGAVSCIGQSAIRPAQAADKPKPPPMMGSAGLCGDGTNLYVVLPGRILKYTRDDLSVAASVELPKPTPPTVSSSTSSSTSTDTTSSTQLPPPPPMGGSGGCWTDGSDLYVITGPLLRVYSPDLTLGTTVELPKPQAPTTSE